MTIDKQVVSLEKAKLLPKVFEDSCFVYNLVLGAKENGGFVLMLRSELLDGEVGIAAPISQ